MSPKCIHCMIVGKVAVVLGPQPKFTCAECKSEYDVEEVRGFLDEYRASWEPTLKWIDSYPSQPKSEP